MTEYFPDGAASAVQPALRAVVAGEADETAPNTLAGGEVLIPTVLAAEDQEPGTVSLPAYEQEDGTELVPVFTSLARMRQALPQFTRHRQVVLGELAHGWPSENRGRPRRPGVVRGAGAVRRPRRLPAGKARSRLAGVPRRAQCAGCRTPPPGPRHPAPHHLGGTPHPGRRRRVDRDARRATAQRGRPQQAAETAKVAADHQGKANVLGVAGLDKNAAMNDFVSQTGTDDFTHLSDEAGEVWKRFGVTEQSRYVILDKDGKTVYEGVLPGGEGLAEKVAGLTG